jgi:hypothetical protein
VALAVELEFRRVVALMAIEDQEPVNSLCAASRMLIEVLDEINASLVGSPAFLCWPDSPGRWKTTLLMPCNLVILCSQYDEWR